MELQIHGFGPGGYQLWGCGNTVALLEVQLVPQEIQCGNKGNVIRLLSGAS